MMSRFENIATWHKAIVSNDNEQVRAAVAGIDFRCFEREGIVRGATNIIVGSDTSTVNLTIQTDDEVVSGIEKGDYIMYNKRKYKIASLRSVRSSAYMGAKEYLIGLE